MAYDVQHHSATDFTLQGHYCYLDSDGNWVANPPIECSANKQQLFYKIIEQKKAENNRIASVNYKKRLMFKIVTKMNTYKFNNLEKTRLREGALRVFSEECYQVHYPDGRVYECKLKKSGQNPNN